MPKRIILLALLGAIMLLIKGIVLAWVEPTQAPPAGNVSAPVNVGSSYQIKSGVLQIKEPDANSSDNAQGNWFHIGRYDKTFAQAKSACEAQGARLAYYSEIVDAFKNGANSCSWGWISEGFVVYPMQDGAVAGCGGATGGVRAWQRPLDSQYGAYCARDSFLVNGSLISGANLYAKSIYLNSGQTSGEIYLGLMPNGSNADKLVLCLGGVCKSSWAEIAGAPINASYLVLGSNTELTNERTLAAGSGITITDGGANNNLTISVNNTAIQTRVTGTCAAGSSIRTINQDGSVVCQLDNNTALPTGTSGQTLRHDGTSWVSNSNIFNTGTNVGIGTNAPAERLDVGGTNNSNYNSHIQLGRFGFLGRFQKDGDTGPGSSYYTYLSTNARHVDGQDENTFLVNNQHIDGTVLSLNRDGLRFLFGDATASNQQLSFTELFRITNTGTVRMNGFQLGSSATAGHVLTTNASGVGTWQALPSGGIGGTGSINSIAKFTAATTLGNSIITDDGTTITVSSPAPVLKLQDNNSTGNNVVSYIDFVDSANNRQGYFGFGSNGDSNLYINNNTTGNFLFTGSGNVGIGATDPSTKLDINGQIKIRGGSPGANKVLTSDASGLATWQTPASGGTVTSVGLSMPAQFSVSNSPITTSGTLTVAWASQSANLVFASPNGSAGSPTFRALTTTDIPNLDASKITTGVFPVARGGTGLSASVEDAVLVGSGTGTWQAKVLPSCSDAVNSKLLYNSSTNTFTCGADQGGGGSGNVDNGTAANQTLRWDTGASKWVPSSVLQNNNTGVAVGGAPVATRQLAVLNSSGNASALIKTDNNGSSALLHIARQNTAGASYVGYQNYNTTLWITGLLANSDNYVLRDHYNNKNVLTAYPNGNIDVLGDLKADRLCIVNDCRNAWPSGGSGLPSGAANQTLRYNGATSAWEASSVLQNNGSLITTTGRLDVNSASGNGGIISSGNHGGTGNAAYFPSGLWANGASSWLYGTIYTNGALFDNGASPARWSINPAGNTWFNLSSGNVGIGTNSPGPGVKLDVVGQVEINGTLDMTQNQVKNMALENRTSDPTNPNPVTGQIWICTDAPNYDCTH